ncbi:MAG: type II toxin-antitoxin system RelE/ParE family toxin [Bacteroidota bacterium]
MIKSIKHKGLRLLWEKNDASKLPASQITKIENILELLDAATSKEDMNYPGSNFHELKGSLQGHYAVKVTGNYRIIFRLENEDVFEVNYIDYH